MDMTELRNGPTPTVDLQTAARVLGVSRAYAYDLARRDEFPCRVLKIGGPRYFRYRVPRAALVAFLDGVAGGEPAG